MGWIFSQTTLRWEILFQTWFRLWWCYGCQIPFTVRLGAPRSLQLRQEDSMVSLMGNCPAKDVLIVPWILFWIVWRIIQVWSTFFELLALLILQTNCSQVFFGEIWTFSHDKADCISPMLEAQIARSKGEIFAEYCQDDSRGYKGIVILRSLNFFAYQNYYD